MTKLRNGPNRPKCACSHQGCLSVLDASLHFHHPQSPETRCLALLDFNPPHSYWSVCQRVSTFFSLPPELSEISERVLCPVLPHFFLGEDHFIYGIKITYMNYNITIWSWCILTKGRIGPELQHAAWEPRAVHRPRNPKSQTTHPYLDLAPIARRK